MLAIRPKLITHIFTYIHESLPLGIGVQAKAASRLHHIFLPATHNLWISMGEHIKYVGLWSIPLSVDTTHLSSSEQISIHYKLSYM